MIVQAATKLSPPGGGPGKQQDTSRLATPAPAALPRILGGRHNAWTVAQSRSTVSTVWKLAISEHEIICFSAYLDNISQKYSP